VGKLEQNYRYTLPGGQSNVTTNIATSAQSSPTGLVLFFMLLKDKDGITPLDLSASPAVLVVFLEYIYNAFRALYVTLQSTGSVQDRPSVTQKRPLKVSSLDKIDEDNDNYLLEKVWIINYFLF
jgi:hypothetical protein